MLSVPIFGGDRVLRRRQLRGLRARERIRRVGRAAAHDRAASAWAWRSRTRGCSTRRSGCSRKASSAPPSWRSSTASSRRWPPSSTCRAIYDAVGDKIREIFSTGGHRHPHLRPADRTWFTSRIIYEHGKRMSIAPHPLSGQGTRGARAAHPRDAGHQRGHGEHQSTSSAAPCCPGPGSRSRPSSFRWWQATRYAGVIDLVDMEREHAFSRRRTCGCCRHSPTA